MTTVHVSAADVMASLGCAQSTAYEHLRRAAVAHGRAPHQRGLLRVPLAVWETYWLQQNQPEGAWLPPRQGRPPVNLTDASSLRKSILDGTSTCEVCGWYCGGLSVLDAHHIVSRQAGGSNSVENLVVLCPNHHRLAHALWGTKRYSGPPSRIELVTKLREAEGAGT